MKRIAKPLLAGLLGLFCLGSMTACGGAAAGGNRYDWPDETLSGFPTWPELDGKITEIKNMDGLWEGDLVYLVKAEIDGEVDLVTNYISVLTAAGYTSTATLSTWTTSDDSISDDLYYCPNPSGPFGTCEGEQFEVTITTSSYCANISVSLIWKQNC